MNRHSWRVNVKASDVLEAARNLRKENIERVEILKAEFHRLLKRREETNDPQEVPDAVIEDARNKYHSLQNKMSYGAWDRWEKFLIRASSRPDGTLSLDYDDMEFFGLT